jgi:hypothetical protein
MQEALRMNLIWFSAARGARANSTCASGNPRVLGALVLGILGTAFVLGVKLGERTGSDIKRNHTTAAFSGALDDEKREITELRASCRTGSTPWRCAWARSTRTSCA